MKNFAFATATVVLIIIMPYLALSQTKEHAELDVPWGAPTPILLASPQGPIQAIERRSRIRATDSSGSSKSRPIVVIAVPSKKLYWLGAEVEPVYFLLAGKIVATQASIGDMLYLYPSTDQMKSSEDESAIQNNLSKRLANIATETFTYKGIPVHLSEFLGFFPFTGVANAVLQPAAKIESVSVDTNGFTINLSGGKENKVKAGITFSNDFNVIQATLNGKQTYPKR